MTWALILYLLGLVPAIISLRGHTPRTIWVCTLGWPILALLTLLTILWSCVKKLATTYLTFTWR